MLRHIKVWFNNFVCEMERLHYWFTEVTPQLQCDVAMFWAPYSDSTMKLEEINSC